MLPPTAMDTVYPEPMSRLYRRAVPKKRPRGTAGRYRTQPVTFAEIQEVDEDNIDESAEQAKVSESSKSEIDLNAKFEEFRRSHDLFRFDKLMGRTTCDEDDEEKISDVTSPLKRCKVHTATKCDCSVEINAKNHSRQAIFDNLRTRPNRFATNFTSLQEK